MSGSALAVHPVRGARDVTAFLALPFRLYRGDRHWVPPLLAERRRFLDPRRNPFFDHGEAALWLARRGRRVVGRISSHVDRLHDATHGERLGMFGFFECEDDLEAALMAATLEAFAASHYATLELGWVLEDNLAVRRLLELAGAPYRLGVHRRYRIYEAPIRACEGALHKL